MSEPPRILLEDRLKMLKLPTFLREYEKVARQSAHEGLDHVQFLSRLVELELIDRERRLVERRIKSAKFPTVKSLDSFEFKAIASLNKAQVLELARCEWMRGWAVQGHLNKGPLTAGQKEAVEASLAGEIGKALEKLGPNVAEVKPDNIGGAVAARWLALSPEARENTGVMAPSHELRQAINGHIRERLAREGRIHGPAMEAKRLVSKGYTDAEKALAANYAAGDVVAFHRPYKRIGVEKGDERRVVGVDHANRAVLLEGKEGGTVAWKPGEIGGRKGGTEVYRAEGIELRAGDRIRWTLNDTGLGLVNSRTAEVAEVRNGRVTFQLEDGRKLELGGNDPQLRHLDHAWASTVHAFQGRTVDNVIAAMEARHPHLTTQKSFYVEISRARDRAELVTDDAAELKAQLQAVTGERIAALEGIGAMERAALEKATEAERGIEGQSVRGAGQDREGPTSPPKDREPPAPERGRSAGMELGL